MGTPVIPLASTAWCLPVRCLGVMASQRAYYGGRARRLWPRRKKRKKKTQKVTGAGVGMQIEARQPVHLCMWQKSSLNCTCVSTTWSKGLELNWWILFVILDRTLNTGTTPQHSHARIEAIVLLPLPFLSVSRTTMMPGRYHGTCPLHTYLVLFYAIHLSS